MTTSTGRRAIGIRDVAASMFIAVALLLPGAVGEPYIDSAVFSEIAEVLRGGGVLYVDAWDHKPPGIFLVDVASQSLMPFVSPWTAAWVASVIFTAATLLLIGVVLRAARVEGRISLALCAAAAGLTVSLVAVGGGLAEVPALAFAMAAFVAVLRRGAGPGRVLLAGGLAGGACMVNPQAASAALAALYLAQEGRSASGRLRAIGAFAVGVAIVGCSTLLWLWSIGALPAAVDAIVTYNSVYVQINRQNIGFTTINQTAISIGCLASLIIPAGFSVIGRGGAAISKSRLTTAAWLWLVAFAVLTAAQGRIAPHYFLLAVPPLAILGSPTFDKASQEIGLRRPRRALLVVLGGFVASAVVVSVVTWHYSSRAGTGDQVRNQATSVGAWLKTNTREDAAVFAWGNQPFLYEAADRRPASKYIYMLPLTTPGYSSPQQVAELVGHLGSEPPQAIIDAGSSAPGEPGWLPLLIPRVVLRVDGRELDLLDPLRAFVRENYHLAAVVDGWPVYLRN